ncbi:STM4013/SEN3800 family hydrolase [Catellatospora sp. NPDC049609]|uniref:STM4013/SEN3800 family hydrolase n=1 Tax=Catellatospora sp. NPDC049609 TaxID=3155505 RepID=UPI0034127E30
MSTDMAALVGTHDLALVTLDTLRYDVAVELAATGRTPHLSRVLPDAGWERRHTPASFTYAAHHAFFAGFLPTPVGPGRHERLFAARFPGSETTAGGTFVFDAPDLVTGLAEAGYHTLCLGGVGFFNRRSALGSVLPGLFAEDHWRPEFGVTEPDSLRHQLDQLQASAAALPGERPLFTFLNVSALHQPNRHYLPGAAEDGRDSHAAALCYVDTQVPRLFSLLTSRGRPCFVIMCADHGTAYGEDGHHGHRIGHDVVWTVPYAQFTLRPGEW